MSAKEAQKAAVAAKKAEHAADLAMGLNATMAKVIKSDTLLCTQCGASQLGPIVCECKGGRQKPGAGYCCKRQLLDAGQDLSSPNCLPSHDNLNGLGFIGHLCWLCMLTLRLVHTHRLVSSSFAFMHRSTRSCVFPLQTQVWLWSHINNCKIHVLDVRSYVCPWFGLLVCSIDTAGSG